MPRVSFLGVNRFFQVIFFKSILWENRSSYQKKIILPFFKRIKRALKCAVSERCILKIVEMAAFLVTFFSKKNRMRGVQASRLHKIYTLTQNHLSTVKNHKITIPKHPTDCNYL